MPKNIDFTQPGGFPLTQDQLGYLQTAWQEQINAVAAAGGTGPYVLSGAVITKTPVGGTVYDYMITDGFVYYEGNIIRVVAGGLAGIDESVDNAYMLITQNATSLTFNDSSTPDVIFETTISLMAQPIGTADDGTHFLLSELVSYGVALGMLYRPDWSSIAVATSSGDGGVTGTIYYKKDGIANTLLIQGTLTSANAQNFDATPAYHNYLAGTLPAGNRPNIASFFTCFATILGTRFKDDAGFAYIDSILGNVDTGGGINFPWVKPDVAISSYTIYFNAIIPLD